jgi:predicted metal-binding protein
MGGTMEKNMFQDDKKRVEDIIRKHDYQDFKWIDPQKIVVAQWVRMKCLFGCNEYGRTATCPPNVPSVSDCERFFKEYNLAVVLHFEKKVDRPEDRFEWTKKINSGLLDLERDIFLSGYQKAFLLFMDSCLFCDSCPGVLQKCKEPKKARPTPEALGMDVFSTVKTVGYPIEVLSEYSQPMNRYAFLFIE